MLPKLTVVLLNAFLLLAIAGMVLDMLLSVTFGSDEEDDDGPR